MFKIIWSKEDAKGIKEKIAQKYDFVLTDNPNEIPHDKVGIIVHEEDYDKVRPLLELIANEKTQLMFETRNGWVQIPVYEMTYLESFGEDIYIHTLNIGNIIIRQPLYQLEEIIKPYHFVRISKSFIVGITKIRYIRTTFNAKLDLELITGRHLEVSRSFVKAFKLALGISNKEESQ
ncbi:MAG: LytTR family transcriptional regulator DNA-binding domain-containing protein [Acholeplasmataceae bacterium]|nr:LytTR family transcriptional regulator DNA-binding domain-containing protein [Acholeplasmataceae bacterium]